jgi:hypothetical protein
MQQLFARRPDGEEPERPVTPPWFQPPQDELPVLLPIGGLLARTPGTVIVVSHLEVHSTGVVIRADVMVRRLDESDRDWSWVMHGGFHRQQDEGDGLHWGVVLADGSTTTLGSSFPGTRRWDEEPDGWTLTYAGGGGGGGGEDRYDQRHGLWLWPLPPAGSIEVVAEWRERGIEESRVTLDGAAVLDAVPRVHPLWP